MSSLMSVDLWDLAPTYEIFHPSASCGATRTLKVSEWSGLFYQRLVVDFPDLKFSNAPDEYENYSCTLQGKDLDLFVMGCDDCFMAVWFDGSPVCDYSQAEECPSVCEADAENAATYIATLLRSQARG